jgi:NAD-dependent deacetylase sirtuin 4
MRRKTRQKVHCKHGHVVDRNEFQDLLSATNPSWKALMDDLERTGQQPRTNPDGDASLFSA